MIKPVIKFYLITEIVFFSCKVLFDYSKPPTKTRKKALPPATKKRERLALLVVV